MTRSIQRRGVCIIPAILCLSLSLRFSECQTAPAALGSFEDHGDVGKVLHPGSVSFDAAKHSYSITASGENIWATADAFQFVWKKISGDVSITADIAFSTKTGNPHKKAVLMIRQSLDADSPYVDAALHVEGLTSLQSRAEKGGATHEVGIASASPVKLRLEKRGADFYMYLARSKQRLHFGGGSMRLVLQEPFYIGLGVCAHDKDAVETAIFSKVTITTPSRGKPKLHSTLETIAVSSTDRRVVAAFDKRVDAPSWTPDGASLIFQIGKKSLRIPAVGGATAKAEPAPGKKSSAKEWPSPDGKQAAFLSFDADESSHGSSREAMLGVRNLSDGKTKILAKFFANEGTMGDSPWSPDGKRLTFVSYQLVP
jgi:TolB protein